MTLKLTLSLVFIALSSLLAVPIAAQDSASLSDKAFSLPDKFFGGIRRKADKMQQRLQHSSEKYFRTLAKKENKLKKRLAKKDPAAAHRIFGDVNRRYDSLQLLANSSGAKLPATYIPRLDSMNTALKFLQGGGGGSPTDKVKQRMSAALKDYAGVQNRINQTQFLQQQISARQQYLKSQLGSLGMVKELQQFQKQVYYYRAQIDEYKHMFQEPAKMEKAVLRVANKIPAFNRFFSKHSQLASLFKLPGNDDPSTASVDGLQTRQILREEMGQRFGTGPNAEALVSQRTAEAQSALANAKNKLNQLGNGGADMDMPNFKPNQQKTKSFLNRLELGTNIQSSKGNSFLPIATDFGLSLGYRISSKSVVGIGSSYRMGWGKDIRHLTITHEGIGLRTFYEMKLKGSIWISGGGEMNYQSRFNHIDELKDYSAWQRSMLAGLSKKYQINKKVKGNFQILYDFLHRSNIPNTQAIIVRIGYRFK